MGREHERVHTCYSRRTNNIERETMTESLTEKKPYVSASQLSMYEMCGESYRRRYIDVDIIPPGIALLRGTGVHEGAKINFRQKIDSHEDLKETDIVDASVSAFEERVKSDGVLLTEEEESEGKENVIGKGKDSVVTLARLYTTETAPEYQPVRVEEKQRIVLKGEYDLLAVMDLSDDQDRVIDLKTTTRKKPADEIEKSEQLSFYSLVFKALEKKLPQSVRLEVLIDKKVPERQMLEGARDTEDLMTLINRINCMIKGVEKGVFMPCNQTSWKCSEKYCGYYHTCKYVKH